MFIQTKQGVKADEERNDVATLSAKLTSSFEALMCALEMHCQASAVSGAHLDVELLDSDGACLAHAMCTADGLVLQGGVEGRLH